MSFFTTIGIANDAPISESIDDCEAYSHMTDSIIMEIERSRDPGLLPYTLSSKSAQAHNSDVINSTSRRAGDLKKTPLPRTL